MTAVRSRTLGVILAGGLARRMGGGDKCLQKIGGIPLLARVRDRLAPQCERLILNSNGDAGRFADFGLEVVPDPLGGHLGPLAGVLAGLEWASARAPQCSYIVTVAADTPFFPRELVAGLCAAAADAKLPAAIAEAPDGDGWRAHPVFALWPVASTAALRAALADAGVRKILDWADQIGCAWARFPATSGRDPFFNVNTPEDLAAADLRCRE